ncbi:hypothetical protein T439DRAFT_324169 [Meredithblackwellia eburnea MCA 4105]
MANPFGMGILQPFYHPNMVHPQHPPPFFPPQFHHQQHHLENEPAFLAAQKDLDILRFLLNDINSGRHPIYKPGGASLRRGPPTSSSEKLGKRRSRPDYEEGEEGFTGEEDGEVDEDVDGLPLDNASFKKTKTDSGVEDSDSDTESDPDDLIVSELIPAKVPVIILSPDSSPKPSSRPLPSRLPQQPKSAITPSRLPPQPPPPALSNFNQPPLQRVPSTSSIASTSSLQTPSAASTRSSESGKNKRFRDRRKGGGSGSNIRGDATAGANSGETRGERKDREAKELLEKKARAKVEQQLGRRPSGNLVENTGAGVKRPASPHTGPVSSNGNPKRPREAEPVALPPHPPPPPPPDRPVTFLPAPPPPHDPRYSYPQDYYQPQYYNDPRAAPSRLPPPENYGQFPPFQGPIPQPFQPDYPPQPHYLSHPYGGPPPPPAAGYGQGPPPPPPWGHEPYLSGLPPPPPPPQGMGIPPPPHIPPSRLPPQPESFQPGPYHGHPHPPPNWAGPGPGPRY